MRRQSGIQTCPLYYWKREKEVQLGKPTGTKIGQVRAEEHEYCSLVAASQHVGCVWVIGGPIMSWMEVVLTAVLLAPVIFSHGSRISQPDRASVFQTSSMPLWDCNSRSCVAHERTLRWVTTSTITSCICMTEASRLCASGQP
jgi:hypothetical protein